MGCGWVFHPGDNDPPKGPTMITFFTAMFGAAMLLAIPSSGLAAEPPMTIKVVYDNYVFDKNLAADWGFACVIIGTERTILLDTGGKGDLLLANLKKMSVRPTDIQVVVISHNHQDHTGGLLPFHSEEELKSVIHELKELGVQKIAPTHCSGDQAIARCKEAFKDGFITAGVGQVIEIQSK